MYYRLFIPVTAMLAFAVDIADAQVVPIRSLAAVESLPAARNGARFTVSGRVSLGPGVLDSTELNVYIQDATGGVMVDDDGRSTPPAIAVGDSVIAVGTVGSYRGQLTLDDADIRAVPAERQAPVPMEISALVPSQLKALQSQLVSLEGSVVLRSIGRGDHILTVGPSNPDGNYVLITESLSGNAHLGLERFSAGDRIRVTGILVHRTSPSTGVTRYALYPRSSADVIPLAMPLRVRNNLLLASIGVLLFATIATVSWRVRSRQRRTRLAAERELRESAARYRLLVDQAPIGIVVHEKGRILFVNRAFVSLLGARTAEDFDGKSLCDFVNRIGDSQLTNSRKDGRHSGAGRTHLELSRLNGGSVEVEVTDSPVVYEGIDCVQAVLYDITERKQAERALAETEAQLRQAQKLEAVGLLAGGIAHDFNNILTVIKGNAELLIRGCESCERVPQEASEINQASDRAAELTYQLLAFSRKQVIKPRVFEIDELVRGLEAMLNRLVPETIHQQFLLGATGGCVSADPGQIEQVIVNLVANARDAMPQGGALTLRTENVTISGATGSGDEAGMPSGSYIRMTLSDTGMGMSAKTRERVFEPFFTTKGPGKGTGLGLATVYGIVKQSQSYIFLHTLEGMGTTFRIYMPRVNEAPEEVSVATVCDDDSMNGGETVLVVDDDNMVRRVVTRILAGHGYNVLQAENGLEALAKVREHPGRIELMLTDVVMPGTTGIEVVAHVARIRRGMRVLYMSGHTDDHLAVHGVLDPDVELIQKPFSPTQLIERVRRVLNTERSMAA